jgi:hypothetical protein
MLFGENGTVFNNSLLGVVSKKEKHEQICIHFLCNDMAECRACYTIRDVFDVFYSKHFVFRYNNNYYT